jgi:hypothetical protein
MAAQVPTVWPMQRRAHRRRHLSERITIRHADVLRRRAVTVRHAGRQPIKAALVWAGGHSPRCVRHFSREFRALR